ncbi:MAG: peptide chain release factor N(5)-glutamine methyltransferase [Clostridia bacterium]|nr:peptide chain release factor N(5)-glutamine methyltransferase [Clostridia bacterium]
MTIREALLSAERRMTDAGVPDPHIDAEWMMEAVTGLGRMQQKLQSAKELTPEQEQRFSSLLLSRANREPVQYLLGEQYFYGLRFHVTPDVLIPRQETEELCEWGLSFLQKQPAPTALDLCTGSGAIAVTLAYRCPKAEVTASDLSGNALGVAQKNALANGVNVRFLQGDLWEPLEGMKFDLILSNPPYIPSLECDTLQPEVMREPRMALDGGADGLDFYRRIAQGAQEHLNPGGMIAVELGIGEAEDVAEMFRRAGLADVEIRKDLYGVERMVGARRRREDHV